MSGGFAVLSAYRSPNRCRRILRKAGGASAGSAPGSVTSRMVFDRDLVLDLDQTLCQRGRGDQCARLRELQGMRQEASFIGVTDGDLDRAQLVQRKPREQELQAVRQQNADMFAPANAECGHAMGQLVDRALTSA